MDHHLHPAVPAALPGRTHVLVVVGNAIVGGVESFVERLVARLPRDRFKVTVLCPFEGAYTERLRALQAEVQVAPMPDDPPWTSLQLATQLVTAGAVDVLHAHLPNAHLLAGLVGCLTGRPVLATIHGRELSTRDLEVHRAVNSHLSMVCKPAYYQALGLGVQPSHLGCDPNGVDTAVYTPDGPRADLRRQLGLQADTPLVGWVGRLSPEKAPEVFVRAVLLLASREPRAHAVMVGHGPMQDQVAGLIERCGLGPRLHLLGLRDDLPALYRDLDVLVSTSNAEAMPLVLLEAMASGVPVVATRVGGVSDLVEHDRCGFLVAPLDFDDMAARTATLLADDARRAGCGRRARERVQADYTLQANVERIGQRLQALAREGRGHLGRGPGRPAPAIGGSGSLVHPCGVHGPGAVA